MIQINESKIIKDEKNTPISPVQSWDMIRGPAVQVPSGSPAPLEPTRCCDKVWKSQGNPDTTRWKHMETHGNSGLVKGEVPSTASSWKGSDTYLTLSSNRSKQVIAVSLAREVNYLKGKSHPCPFGGQFISPQSMPNLRAADPTNHCREDHPCSDIDWVEPQSIVS